MSNKLLDSIYGSEEHLAISQLVKKITTYVACCMTHRAWDKVTTNAIANIWKQGGSTKLFGWKK
jgi:hypothetical protein